MAFAPQPFSGLAAPPAIASPPQRFVARQPILDRNGGVYGYELLARSGSSNIFDASDPTAATCRTIDTSLLIGTNSLTEGRRAFINCTREILLSDMVTVLPSKVCVLEILEDVEPDREVLDRCRSLRKSGYTLAMDDFTGDLKYAPFIEIAEIIKVDFLATNVLQQADFARYAKRGTTLLAEKVENREQFELAKKLGYTYFQGYFFAKPTMVSSADISLLQSKCLRILQKAFDPEYEPKEVAAIIKQEPSLCYRLLRYLDSAAFGLYPIRTIGHALTILGQRETQKWVALVTAVMLGKKTSTALVSMALVRARFCELMAVELHGPSTDYFLVGLLSLMDALLSQPMSAVLAQLPISDECRAALEGQENSLSRILQLVVACERGEWGLLSRQCSALDAAESVVWSLYSQAIQWARSFILEK
jgi:EAL and modified HD-GYP domain-containing signal transduction protein